MFDEARRPHVVTPPLPVEREAVGTSAEFGRIENPLATWGSVMVGTRSPSRLGIVLQYFT